MPIPRPDASRRSRAIRASKRVLGLEASPVANTPEVEREATQDDSSLDIPDDVEETEDDDSASGNEEGHGVPTHIEGREEAPAPPTVSQDHATRNHAPGPPLGQARMEADHLGNNSSDTESDEEDVEESVDEASGNSATRQSEMLGQAPTSRDSSSNTDDSKDSDSDSSTDSSSSSNSSRTHSDSESSSGKSEGRSRAGKKRMRIDEAERRLKKAKLQLRRLKETSQGRSKGPAEKTSRGARSNSRASKKRRTRGVKVEIGAIPNSTLIQLQPYWRKQMKKLESSIPLTIFDQTFALADKREHERNQHSSTAKGSKNKGLCAPSEYRMTYGEWTENMSLFKRYLVKHGQDMVAGRLNHHIRNVKRVKRETECWMTALRYDIMCQQLVFVEREDKKANLKDIGTFMHKYEIQVKNKSLTFGESNGGESKPYAKGGRFEFKDPETGANITQTIGLPTPRTDLVTSPRGLPFSRRRRLPRPPRNPFPSFGTQAFYPPHHGHEAFN